VTNWTKVAKRDAALRASVDNASEELAKHRYDNTIGAGVSFREYARKCGVDEAIVRRYVKAHEMRTSGPHLSMSDALVKASTSAEQADVIEVVAEARGTSMKNVQAHHGDEVRRVRNMARERAERRGTNVRDEAEVIARTAVRQERSQAKRRTDRKAKTDLRFIELERHLLAARRALMNAVAVEVELEDEHVELLGHAVGVVRDLLNLVDLKFIGAGDVDWDAELARLGEA
jgi:hypothetical protein